MEQKGICKYIKSCFSILTLSQYQDLHVSCKCQSLVWHSQSQLLFGLNEWGNDQSKIKSPADQATRQSSRQVPTHLPYSTIPDPWHPWCLKAGKRKATVFPLPVVAIPMMSCGRPGEFTLRSLQILTKAGGRNHKLASSCLRLSVDKLGRDHLGQSN